MLSYATVGTDDIERAVAFYDELLGLIGGRQLHTFSRGVFYGDERIELGVMTPFDERPASGGNGPMVMLTAASREVVDAVHARALTLGGIDEGAPGVRGSGGYYIGYFRDPDGNKLAIGHR